MHNQKHFIFLAVLILGVSGSLAQERQFIVQTEVTHQDSGQKNIIFSSDQDTETIWEDGRRKFVIKGPGNFIMFDDSSKQQTVVHQRMRTSDSTGAEFIMDHNFNIELLGDSLSQNVFIVKNHHSQQKTARIIIKKSGFFRKNKIIIDYDPRSLEIFKVADNDELIPANKFHKYRDYLEESTEYAELEALHPRLEEFEFRIQTDHLNDSAKLNELTILLEDLQTLKSDRAHFIKQQYSTIKRVIELDELEEVIQTILSDAGLKPPQKIEDISIKKGKFFLNGEEVKGEIGQKCIQAYASQSDLTLEDLEKKGDEISIRIDFD